MARRTLASAWARSFERSIGMIVRAGLGAGRRQIAQAVKLAAQPKPRGPGDWLHGLAFGLSGLLRYFVYRPAGLAYGERVPLVVMLHGCGQDARAFAASTRMNRLADRERFLVLYPEQDRVSNPQGCWNWFEIRSGRAQAEASLILKAIDQAVFLYSADPGRVALCGLSAGASMAALLATRHASRFQAVVMHSGVAPGSADTRAAAMRAMRGAQLVVPMMPNDDLPPLMVIHGTHDRVVSSRNARAAVSLWAQAGGASETEPQRLQRGHRHAMNVTRHARQGRDVATLVEIESLGHAWSGGAAKQPHGDSRGPDAARLAWSFIRRQFGG